MSIVPEINIFDIFYCICCQNEVIWFKLAIINETCPFVTDTLKLRSSLLISLMVGVFCNPKLTAANNCVLVSIAVKG